MKVSNGYRIVRARIYGQYGAVCGIGLYIGLLLFLGVAGKLLGHTFPKNDTDYLTQLGTSTLVFTVVGGIIGAILGATTASIRSRIIARRIAGIVLMITSVTLYASVFKVGSPDTEGWIMLTFVCAGCLLAGYLVIRSAKSTTHERL